MEKLIVRAFMVVFLPIMFTLALIIVILRCPAKIYQSAKEAGLLDRIAQTWNLEG